MEKEGLAAVQNALALLGWDASESSVIECQFIRRPSNRLLAGYGRGAELGVGRTVLDGWVDDESHF